MTKFRNCLEIQLQLGSVVSYFSSLIITFIVLHCELRFCSSYNWLTITFSVTVSTAGGRSDDNVAALVYTVESSYDDIGLYDASATASYILWHQLLPHC